MRAAVPSIKNKVPQFHSGKLPFGYWRSFENRRKFFEWASDVFGIKSLDAWYHIKKEQVVEIGGDSLISHYYNNSLPNALISVFHEFSWKPWLFEKVPRRYWNEDKNVIKYLKWLSDQLSITNLADWSLVTREELTKHGGSSLLTKFGSVSNLLSHYYPDIDWSTKLQSHPNICSKAQLLLFNLLQKLFPSQQVVMDYKDSKLIFEQTKRPMEFDVYLPESCLAFEYHGEQHYGKHFLYGDHEGTKHRDQIKRDFCASRGLTLIEIPFWWDRSRQSLAATIKSVRPDLLQHVPFQGQPISTQMPTKFADKFQKINQTFESVFQYVPEFPKNTDPTGWAVTPKFRGVHCLWNGHDLSTKNGMKIQLPAHIKDMLPSFKTDFVLSSFMNGVDIGSELIGLQLDFMDTWNLYQLHLIAVDTPSPTLDFTSRAATLKQTLSSCQYLKSIEPVHCKGSDHLNQMISESLKKGWEGVVLRKPSSYYYEPASLYVVKSSPSEKGLVCDITNDTVSCKLVALPEKFQSQIRIGSVVTITHKGTNSTGALQWPALSAVNRDVSWDAWLAGRVGYRLAAAKGSGLCRACRRKLNQQGPLKVEVKGIFTPTYATPHPAKYGICLNESCLTKVSQMFSDGSDAVCIPRFQGKILLPSALNSSLQQAKKDSSLARLEFIPCNITHL